MRINIKNSSDEVLKFRAFNLLAQGVIPYANWVNIFANPDFAKWLSLQAQAFNIWFPTMLDYLFARNESIAIKNELDRRKIQYGEVFQLSDKLESCFKKILSLYTKEEQIFIRDRRLQNVHGTLQLNMYEMHNIKIYDSQITSINLTPEEYGAIIVPFTQNLPAISGLLVSRLLKSEEFSQMTHLYLNHLHVGTHLAALISKLEIPVVIGNG